MHFLFVVVIPHFFTGDRSPDQEAIVYEGISITMVHTWADMLYNICTNDVFRSDSPIVNIRFYIDLM